MRKPAFPNTAVLFATAPVARPECAGDARTAARKAKPGLSLRLEERVSPPAECRSRTRLKAVEEAGGKR